MYRPDIELLVRNGAELLFYVLIIIFCFHAMFLAYHWFTYGNNQKVSMLAFALYLCGGAILFLTLSSTFTLL
jgi:hypothetical protein